MAASYRRRATSLQAFLVAATLLATVEAQPIGNREDEIERLVVMISCQGPGAGIVVGYDGARLYVATAAHVVRDCAGGTAEIRLRGQDATFQGRVVRTGEGDLAILGIEGAQALGAELPFDRLGDAEAVKRGDAVYALGNPRGVEWSVNATPDKVSRVNRTVIRFQSEFIREGHSGGALLNENWDIVGMIQRDNPPQGEALSMARILAALREWGYPVALRPPVPRISAGLERTCLVSSSGQAECWGNVEFEPGPAVSALRIQGASFRSISVGGFHICGLGTDGIAYCFGTNKYGQWGQGTTSEMIRTNAAPIQGNLVFTSISAGGWHTCGLTQEGRAYCWGAGTEGRLGNDLGVDSAIPVGVAGGLKFKVLSAGYRNTCGVTAGGVTHCWGGVGGTGRERWGSTVTPNAFVPVRVPGNVILETISVGAHSACGLAADGKGYCWGENAHGKLGTGSTEKESESPQRVAGGLRFRLISVAIGDHACGVTRTGVAYCWGGNDAGQLGDGTKNDSAVPVAVAGGLRFATLSTGNLHTCGVTTDGSTYCWGGGNLGIGIDTQSRAGTTVPLLVTRVP
jgi:alpha-tubulin suppressor-like RCC1 family protein